ncbi:MAG: glutamate synthase subunit beta [Candidatus Marinimicrobia bacterium]|nr:glutamate synthase subunit beta [Candidatus Neomarinimicrobiota bacterium]
MDKRTGFLTYKRQYPEKLNVEERLKNFEEFEKPLTEEQLNIQAARCMNCGVPFCHDFGCPLANRIPDINDKVFRGLWKEALAILHSTHNFPEFTGRICPAPCEEACTLTLDDEAVSFRQIELQIVEHGWDSGYITPQACATKTGRKVAIIGSGPSGLAAAQQLARAGHLVIVFEQASKIGGLLRYGIPDYKLDKTKIDRRIQQMEKEGVKFETGVEIGVDISFNYLLKSYDAVLIATGARTARELNIPGRDLQGIHQALDYLTQQNRTNAGEKINKADRISAKDKTVVVIGGGDTGADCVGTALRQGAKSVTQIELLPQPPHRRAANNPWPEYRQILRTSTSHEEGCQRIWSHLTKEFIGESGKVKKIMTSALDWNIENRQFTELQKETIHADLVLLAIGFLSNKKCEILNNFLKVGNFSADEFLTEENQKAIFTAGDVVEGPSLVVNAIFSGRKAAKEIDEFLSY